MTWTGTLRDSSVALGRMMQRSGRNPAAEWKKCLQGGLIHFQSLFKIETHFLFHFYNLRAKGKKDKDNWDSEMLLDNSDEAFEAFDVVSIPRWREERKRESKYEVRAESGQFVGCYLHPLESRQHSPHLEGQEVRAWLRCSDALFSFLLADF